MRTVKVILAILILGLIFAPVASASETVEAPETVEGRVERVVEEREDYQKLEVTIAPGTEEEERVEVEVGGEFQKAGQMLYSAGDKVLLTQATSPDGRTIFYITDFIRRTPLLYLTLIFIALVLMVGRWYGACALLGMALSFGVIVKLILPQIYAGRDPVLVALLGSLLIIPLTFYLSHGINRKTTIAVVGTVVSLAITALLSRLFVELTYLSGYASEEAAFLQMAKGGAVNVKGLLLAGMMIGTLGVLDDVTVSQAVVVRQLRRANKGLGFPELYRLAMEVGQDHIASMVNTLILVYTGAALPLLLLFIDTPQPFGVIINHEMLAEEVVRTLVGSIGLVLAVPITTLLAVRAPLDL